jgi:hypothetical protein
VAVHRHEGRWRTNIVGPKPLSAWCRISGEIPVAYTPFWVVELQVEESPGSNRMEKIFLRSAPLAEKQRFEAALERKKIVDSEIKRGNADAENRIAAFYESGDKIKTLQTVRDAQILPDPGLSMTISREAAARDRMIKGRDQRLRNQQEVAAESERLKSDLALSTQRNVFAVDVFALRTGEFYNGVRVYDIGIKLAK